MKVMKTPLVCAAFAVSFMTYTQAQFIVWDGSEGDDWANGDNWEGGAVPGATDTAVIREGSPTLPNNTVLKTGNNVSIDRVFLGDGGAVKSGHLTVESGASLTTVQQVSATGGSVFNLNGTATVGGAGVQMGNTSVATINGTLNGELQVNSTQMQFINQTGIVNGKVGLNGSDQLTVAGQVNGLFNANGTSTVVIASTASIMSDGGDSWLYDDVNLTWNVGADAAIGTLKTNRSETALDAYDGEWRFNNGASAVFTVVLDDYDTGTYGDTISGLQLVTGIEQEANFASKVVFMLNGDDVTSDFSWDGLGTGSFSGTLAVPEPSAYALLAGCFGLTAVMLRRRRA